MLRPPTRSPSVPERSTVDRIYLDYAASTPLAPEARVAMEPYGDDVYGNPSSRHAMGVAAREAVDAARREVARAVGARAARVSFVASGTEANNLGVLGAARALRKRGRHVLIGAGEHASVRAPALALLDEGFEVDELPLDELGRPALERLESSLRKDTVLVATMLVNNELGCVTPLRTLRRQVARVAPDAHVHVDAVQALGKLPLSLEELGADSLSVSSHKVHGPKGAAALALSDRAQLAPLIHGGGQEHGLRSGTENVAAIVGFASAARLAVEAREELLERADRARELLFGALEQLEGVTSVLPAEALQHSTIVSLVLPGPPAEVWQHHLEREGVYVGVGSACQSNKAGISATLSALGYDAARAKQVLRVSFGRTTTEVALREALAALRRVHTELARVGPNAHRRPDRSGASNR